MSVFGVILVRIFPHSDWIRRDIRYELGKIQTRITPNTHTFYLVIVFEMSVSSRVSFIVSTWKLVDQGFYSQFLMSLIARFECPNNAHTELVEMLIILHIFLFLMSYDSSKISLGDIETKVSYNQSREVYCDLPLGKFDFLYNHLSDSSYIGFHSQFLRFLWKLMKYSQNFKTFKGY